MSTPIYIFTKTEGEETTPADSAELEALKAKVQALEDMLDYEKLIAKYDEGYNSIDKEHLTV